MQPQINFVETCKLRQTDGQTAEVFEQASPPHLALVMPFQHLSWLVLPEAILLHSATGSWVQYCRISLSLLDRSDTWGSQTSSLILQIKSESHSACCNILILKEYLHQWSCITCISSLSPAVGEGLYSDAVKELLFFFCSWRVGLPVPGSPGVPHVWYTYKHIRSIRTLEAINEEQFQESFVHLPSNSCEDTYIPLDVTTGL